MNAQATRRGLPAVALWGGLGALAWAAITVLTGGSAAHADDKPDVPLLDGVSSLVSETASTVGDTVTTVTAPVVRQVVKPVVTEVVAPVVTQVVVPVQQATPVVEHAAEIVTKAPVVGPAAAPVVAAVTDTARAVVAPVTELLADAPVSQIVAPVQDAVAALPIVGGLIDELGVTSLLDDVVGVVDTTTGLVAEAVDDTVPPVLAALDPLRPDDEGPVPGAGSIGGADAIRAATSSSQVPATAVAALARSALGTPPPPPQPVAFPAASGTTSAPDGDPTSFRPPAGAPAAPSSSAGSGGASALSHARLSDVGIPALRAVERAPGAPDDVLPTSLVADTDVSPD